MIDNEELEIDLFVKGLTSYGIICGGVESQLGSLKLRSELLFQRICQPSY